MMQWIDACAAIDIDQEDLIAWHYGTRQIAIYNTENQRRYIGVKLD